MPAPVRRILLIAASLATVGLTFVASAAADNGGLGPPSGDSPNASQIADAYWFIFALTAAIFVIVAGLLIFFVVRYRSRGRAREVEGAQVHGHTRLELIWTVIPVLILVAIASFVFYKLPGINDVPVSSQDRLNVKVDAHQFYWQFTYPNGEMSFNELHVPVNTVVYLTLNAHDVIHSFWVPELAGKTDAIPGRENHMWFQALHAGTYKGNCAELCGLYHAKMPITVVAEPLAAYRKYVNSLHANLGKSEFGVCETCHGIGGKGGYGPALAGNPLVLQPVGLRKIVREGRVGRAVMPPVGNTWTAEQMRALVVYLRQNFKGATLGG
jgi:cytochrome c oxidase subunit II